MPFLAAGAVSIVGGIAKDRALTPDMAKAVFGTVALVMVASATDGTRIAPLMRAIGLLTLLAAVMAASKYIGHSPKLPTAATGGSSSGSW